jgi:hypothetical protein
MEFKLELTKIHSFNYFVDWKLAKTPDFMFIENLIDGKIKSFVGMIMGN